MPAHYAPILSSHKWRKGEDKYLWFRMKVDGEIPADLEDWNFEWQLRENAEDPDPILIKTTGDGSVSVADHLDPESELVVKMVRVFVPRSDSLVLDPGVYEHALRRTDAGLSTVTAEGPAELLYAATR